jgi:hypothetical protein
MKFTISKHKIEFELANGPDWRKIIAAEETQGRSRAERLIKNANEKFGEFVGIPTAKVLDEDKVKFNYTGESDKYLVFDVEYNDEEVKCDCCGNNKY